MPQATWSDAFPLTWPVGWRRTPSDERRSARFAKSERRAYSSDPGSGTYRSTSAITIAVALDRLRDQLERMGADWDRAVISTNVETRRDGLPRSDRGTPADPGVAVYWTVFGEVGQQCMAIDIYDTVAGNLAAVAATLDAMRAIERHGGATILERAFQGFKALPSATTTALSIQGAAGVLARRSGASAELIAEEREVAQRAYREAARRAHPDVGGTTEDFQLVGEAKRVLEAHFGGAL